MSGDTYNNYNNYFNGTQLLDPPTAAPRHVAEDQLERLQRQFARPERMNAAYDTLESEHTVFLHGAQGCGRSAAARVLLCELPSDRGAYHELNPEVPDGEGSCLSADLIGAGDRILLDLSTADVPLWQAVRRELSGFRHELLRRSAFLAVVLPHRFEDDLPSEFVRTWIGRPDTKEAFARHLRSHGIDDGLWSPLPDEARTHLATRPAMGELARLVGRIAEARAAGQPTDTFHDWLRTALASRADHSATLDALLPDLPEGRQRALLLASALLEDAPAEAVHASAALLLRRVGSADDDRPMLEHPGLTERLDPLKARLTADGRVRFERRGFAEATLRYFWANLPHLRETLREWFCATLRKTPMPAEPRARMVGRFTALCLSVGETTLVTRLIEQWTASPAPRAPEVTAAAQALRHGVLDEEHGRVFLRQMYDWSRSPVTDPLRAVLIEVCEKVLSIHRPDAALVRLHHLARRDPETRGVAALALLRFADQDARILRRLLFRLATTRNTDHHRADARLFLQLPDLPPGFLLQRSPREWVTACWDRAFLLEPAEWGPAARAWLLRADGTQDARLTDAVLRILTDASLSKYAIASRLYADARRTTSPALAARLLHAINQAQSTAFAARAHRQEVPVT
ncbi:MULTISPECIES: hypothetical protein [unclassified Streptomyces]|uniref:hypothetical protein n=1 Tax=unclassified Streptomyces TaxID=2593676 RepID=UPI00278C517F|nr:MULTISPECIES: hypothetical protein [unclassified Streptomyces]